MQTFHLFGSSKSARVFLFFGSMLNQSSYTVVSPGLVTVLLVEFFSFFFFNMVFLMQVHTHWIKYGELENTKRA